MVEVKLFQRELKELVRVTLPSHPIDLGKFTTLILGDILKDDKVKKELGLNFDDLKVYPGPQPRESADIELLRNGEIIGMINVKTCVSGILKAALRKLKSSIRPGEDGAVIMFALCQKGESTEARMIIALIPEKALKSYETLDIQDVIQSKIREKAEKEGYNTINLLAANEAIEIERLKIAVKSEEKAERAYEAAARAEEKAERAYEAAAKTREEVMGEVKRVMGELQQVREEVKQVMGEVKHIMGELQHVKDTVDKGFDTILKTLKEKKS
nr:hypothetical protein [Candidatus Freyrarchaeum guaymaensis]